MGKYNMRNIISKIKSAQWSLLVIAILLYITFYIPLPYFITTPGSAIELGTIVEVKEGYKSEDFMLTTVSMMPATISTYIFYDFSSFAEIIPEDLILYDDEDSDDYSKRQLNVMKQSQDSAIIAAFNYLEIPIIINKKGVLVMGLLDGTPSDEILRVGDLIIEIDQQPIKAENDLFDYLKTKQAGDIAEVVLIRDNKQIKEEVPVIRLKDYTGYEDYPSDKVGFGLYPHSEIEIIPSKEVMFHTKDIGGPSAGLMFTLEIINQLTPIDYTKGYEIAGTGTIDADGNIGQIGGARLKVKAAYEKGAEIFFVPKDILAEDINQAEAEQANIDIGSPMKIVPVATIDEAMEYLINLQPK